MKYRTHLESAQGPATLKAAAHVHSEWSDDASWQLSRVAAVFSRRKFQVVLMCEHSRGFTSAKWEDYWVACERASTDRILLVPGIEYGDRDDVIHIPVWGRVPFFGEAPPIDELLAQARAAGGTPVWAHPFRRAAWQHFDPSWREYLAAIEVWNRKYDGVAPNLRSLSLARQAATAQFVCLDLHTSRQLFPLSMRLAVAHDDAAQTDSQGRLSPDAVYAALQQGSFAPQAFGISLEHLTSGAPALALRAIESGRRAAAKLSR